MKTKQAKRLYYQDLLKKNKTDLSKTCKAIGSIVNMRRKSKSTACLNDNSALLFNLVKIAGTLKSFFTNIGLNITKKICEMKETTDGISKKQNFKVFLLLLKSLNVLLTTNHLVPIADQQLY